MTLEIRVFGRDYGGATFITIPVSQENNQPFNILMDFGEILKASSSLKTRVSQDNEETSNILMDSSQVLEETSSSTDGATARKNRVVARLKTEIGSGTLDLYIGTHLHSCCMDGVSYLMEGENPTGILKWWLPGEKSGEGHNLDALQKEIVNPQFNKLLGTLLAKYRDTLSEDIKKLIQINYIASKEANAQAARHILAHDAPIPSTTANVTGWNTAQSPIKDSPTDAKITVLGIYDDYTDMTRTVTANWSDHFNTPLGMLLNRARGAMLPGVSIGSVKQALSSVEKQFSRRLLQLNAVSSNMSIAFVLSWKNHNFLFLAHPQPEGLKIVTEKLKQVRSDTENPIRKIDYVFCSVSPNDFASPLGQEFLKVVNEDRSDNDKATLVIQENIYSAPDAFKNFPLPPGYADNPKNLYIYKDKEDYKSVQTPRGSIIYIGREVYHIHFKLQPEETITYAF